MKTALILSLALFACPASAQDLFLKLPPGASGPVQWVRPAVAPIVKPAPKPAPKPDYARMSLGINVNVRSNTGANRVTMNLAEGRYVLRTYNSSGAMPADRFDAAGNVVKLLPGEAASRVISAPTRAFMGQTTDIICRWDGKGDANVWGNVATKPKLSAQSLTFTFVPNGTVGGNIQFKNIDPANPVRNVDCREADADPKAVWNPTFIADLKRYSVVRFMKWQTAVGDNNAVTWAGRSTPARSGNDGEPIETMVQLANLAKVSPWFCMPWNADEEYIRKFAEYVRDNLDPSLTVNVETSNEVWNSAYGVTTQAIREGVAKGLHPTDKYTAGTKRYAERATEVADIWSAVFVGKMSRLQRVIAFQQGTYGPSQGLGFRDTAKHFDVLATAPYFASSPAPGSVPDVGAWIVSTLIPKVDQAISIAMETKAIATKYGLRYVTYEAGQHVNSSKDVPLLTAINRHPAMADAYTRYLSAWKAGPSDLMVLFADYATIGKFGAWGQQEFTGQPLSDAPKARAVDAFIKSNLPNRATP